ncbi:hypothetical protein HK097_008752 [Rhizophlyctis rosea]|uniref:Ammonium transporter n=1 Tax=Rhizophlyctis rosea TaxID=64517 RepID=A0AAD5X3R5_9FUNG|nr:hypothetical protein HK097_008752 [Rhizophlyctis rosea]
MAPASSLAAAVASTTMALAKRQDEAPAAPLVDSGANAWVMASAALVLLMLPGLGYFYSGLSHHKNALVFLHLCMLSLAIVSIQWFLWGFSLSFSPNSTNGFIGDIHFMGFRNVDAQPYPGTVISTDVFAMFQGLFCALTAALPFGSAADRTRVLPSLFFIVIWATFVYNPIAYWAWAPNGWLRTRGYLDFAGGAAVEIASGFAGLAFALYMGPRKTRIIDEKPHNVGYVILGTAMLWFGWLGFNAGSATSADARAGMALITTHLCGATAGLTWMLCEYVPSKKYSAVGFCTGAVAGLVSITPAAGFVAPWAAVVIGVVSGSVCRWVSVMTKKGGRLDDTLDVFAVHGVGGIIGTLLTGVFAQEWIIGLNSTGTGGVIEGHWHQLLVQFYATVAAAAYTFVVTYIIFFLLDHLPGLHLRVKDDQEAMGVDLAQMGEYAYNYQRAESSLNPVAGFGSMSLDPLTEKTTSQSVVPMATFRDNSQALRQVQAISGNNNVGGDERHVEMNLSR